MGYSMGSIDCLAVDLREDYKKALIKDLKELKVEDIEDSTQRELFIQLKDFYDEPDKLNADDLLLWEIKRDVMYYDHDENYAYYRTVDSKTGKPNAWEDFDGECLPIGNGNNSIYEPKFKNWEELEHSVKEKELLYIPREFDLKNHIIFLTGVWGG